MATSPFRRTHRDERVPRSSKAAGRRGDFLRAWGGALAFLAGLALPLLVLLYLFATGYL